MTEATVTTDTPINLAPWELGISQPRPTESGHGAEHDPLIVAVLRDVAGRYVNDERSAAAQIREALQQAFPRPPVSPCLDEDGYDGCQDPECEAVRAARRARGAASYRVGTAIAHNNGGVSTTLEWYECTLSGGQMVDLLLGAALALELGEVR